MKPVKPVNNHKNGSCTHSNKIAFSTFKLAFNVSRRQCQKLYI